MLARLKTLLRPNKQPAHGAAVISATGIRRAPYLASAELRWTEVRRVSIEWSENPWGDPWAGRYCDTDWVIFPCEGPAMSFWDTEENRASLLNAFAANLAGFDFDYKQFDAAHSQRILEFEGGSYLVWAKSV